MDFKQPMLVVTDMDKTIEFYERVLGLKVVMDFGANKTLTGGLALQTLETYRDFIGTSEIFYGGNNFEIYFKKMILINLQIILENLRFNTFIQLRNILGDSVWFVSMTQTGILLKWAKI